MDNLEGNIKPTKYSNSKIYKIVNTVSEDPKDIYVGSTCQKLKKRFYGHILDYKRTPKPNNNYLFQAIDEYGIESFQIILIENFPCQTSKELFQREEYYRKILNTNYNRKKAYITEEEKKISDKYRYEVNRDKNLIKMKEYRDINRELLNKKKEKFRKEHYDRIVKQRKNYKEKSLINKKNHCDICDHSFLYPSTLERHYKTQKHELKVIEMKLQTINLDK